MNCVTLQPPARPGKSVAGGYVLFDVLVALLLFATVLMAGGWALIGSVAASRAASLQTTAVDLAADLTESLQVTPHDATHLAQWQAAVRQRLPAGSAALLTADEGPAGTGQILIQWRDHADGAAASLRLPVPSPWPDAAR